MWRNVTSSHRHVYAQSISPCVAQQTRLYKSDPEVTDVASPPSSQTIAEPSSERTPPARLARLYVRACERRLLGVGEGGGTLARLTEHV